jgi:hypothetical protein
MIPRQYHDNVPEREDDGKNPKVYRRFTETQANTIKYFPFL